MAGIRIARTRRRAATTFRTSDGGTSWSRVAEGAPFDGPIHFRTTTEGWALGAQLHRTEDGGRTWKLQHPPAPFLEGLPGRFIALSMFGPRGVLQVAIPTGMQAFPVFDVTSDGGRTWTAREGDDMTYAGTGHPLLLAASDADHWHVARGAEVWTTADAARHWTKQQDLPGMTFALSFPTHVVGWAAVRTDLCPTPETCEQRWSLMSTLDGGERWEPITLPGS